MFAARRLARAASTRGVDKGTSNLFSSNVTPTKWRSAQTATAASESTSSAGWMGRPATDADAANTSAVHEDDTEMFPSRTPADVDAEHFRQGASVEFWNAWKFDDTPGGFKKLADDIAPTITSASDARYWTYHVFRSSWFLGQGAAVGLYKSNPVYPQLETAWFLNP
jgi:hypothetical protein